MIQKINRILRIVYILWRFDLFGLLRGVIKAGPIYVFLIPLSWLSPSKNLARGERIRLALEALGPVFITRGYCR